MKNPKLATRYTRRFLCALLSICISFGITSTAFSMESTNYTYLISADDSRYLRTQDAYIPGGTYLSNIGLSAPEDMYLFNNQIYIADTGNARIVVYTTKTGQLSYLGEGLLQKPTGVAVATDGRIFVADYGSSEIVILSKDGRELSRIAKPQEVIYGASPYMPTKVGTDSFGNIFAISEGTYEGILQFNSDGAFNGFFGANKTKNLSFVQWFQKVFYTDEQKNKMFFHTPPNIVSIDVSPTNLIYSVTQQDYRRALKKLNLAGVDIFVRANKIKGENNFVDTAVSLQGNVYAITDTGSISEYDNEGNLLLMFGGRAASGDRNGLTAVVSAIEVDEACNLYVLDKERALIQTYYPTDYAKLIHAAYESYNEGKYDDALNAWGELMRMNPNTYITHFGYGNSLFQLGQYDAAAQHYKTIYRADLYSDCFWELRSEWLRNNMASILIMLAALTAVAFILWIIKQKLDFTRPIKKVWSTLKKQNNILRHLFSDTSYLIKHPIDCYYDIKHGTRGGVGAASVLYISALLVYVCTIAFGTIIFEGYGFAYFTSPVMKVFSAAFPVALFVIGSYLISSINNGEGSFKNAYTACGYMLTPYIIFSPIMLALSHIMTLKEQFVYQFCQFLIIGYTLILLFLAVKETHCYTPKKTIANLLLTLAFMLITVVALVVLYILWKELFDFILEIFEEVRYRVTN